MVRALKFILMSAMLVGCGRPTPEPTPTPTLTFTPTPLPTLTLTPTPTATPALKTVKAEADGFILQVPTVLGFEVTNKILGVYDQEGTFLASFMRAPYDGRTNSLEDVIDNYFKAIEERGAKFTQDETKPIVIGGLEGVTVAVTGILSDRNVEGQAVAVAPVNDSVFFAIGVSNLESGPDLWKTSGSYYFEAMIASVQFIETQTNDGCPVSEDKTYGYTESNPIRVGGDFLEGPARERAYLDNLLGPNGEIMTYERNGSISSGDTILDVYHVTGANIEVVLYLDEYRFEPLQAPYGLTCAGEFPLSAP